MNNEIIISLPVELIEKIDAEADQEQWTRSEFIQKAIRFYIDELDLRRRIAERGKDDITEGIENLVKNYEDMRRRWNMAREQ